MAVTNATSRGTSAGRRWFFGANVAVMTVLAVFVLVGVNLIGHLKNSRWDLTGGISGHRVSDRTRSILDQCGRDQPIRITTVYASDDPETARKEYFPRVEDLCEELRQIAKRDGVPIEVEHIVSGNDQARLRDRIEEKFGTAAHEYNNLVTLAQEVWKDVTGAMGAGRQQVVALVSGDSWLGSFPTLANIASILQKDLKSIEDNRQEVENLVHGEGIPRYAEANDKIKTLCNDLRQHLEQIQNWMKEVQKLATVLGDPDAPFAKQTRASLQKMTAKVDELRKIAGDPATPDVPADPKPVLQNYAKAALALGEWLSTESARVATFQNEYPALRQHPRWQIKSGVFVMELSALLTSAAESLSTNARALRGYLQRNVPLDQLQNLVRQTRQLTAEVQETLGQWNTNVLAILDEGTRIDATTREFLAQAGGGRMFDKALARLGEVTTKIGTLPELKLDEVASRLQQDNIIVVERGNDVRVVGFDETWPYADPMARQMGARGEEGPPARVFDGDSVISNALLAMLSTKPVARVVLVTFEEEVAPQMRQFQRPMTGPMPLEAVRVMRQQLEKMQFKVEEWNLAEENAREKKPKDQEGVPAIYVFLPPPPPLPPFAMRQPQKQFGKAEIDLARETLAGGGRAVFLANWDQPFRFGPPSEYGWEPLLRDDWGIRADVGRRVIRGVVDRKQPGRYAIDVVQWWYMQLSNFTDQPIGAPLRARRVLMKDVCPVAPADRVPDGVTVHAVLEVPAGTTDIWAEKDIERIFTALSTGAREGSFTRSDEAIAPPFTVVLAAEKASPASAPATASASTTRPAWAGRVVVMGNGLSLRDDYLQQRVVRFGGKGTRLSTDPPPTENLDLLVNALYWLSDRADLIAAGPAEVPVVAAMSPDRTGLWTLTVGWAFLSLVLGGIMWVIRRK